MRVLVTGATGFVGLNIVENLLDAGHTVTAVAADPVPDAARRILSALPGALSEHVVDVADAGALEAAIASARPDAVVVGAALTPGAAQEAAAIPALAEINILATLRTLDIALAQGVSRAVVLSSAAVYGAATPMAGWLDEAGSPPQPAGAYAISKFAAEQLALRMAATRDADIGVVRIGAAFGPWERDTGIRETLSPLLQVMRHHRDGTPAILPREGRRDFIYGRDVARAVAAMVDTPGLTGPVNIGLGAEWSVADWCAALAGQRDLTWRIAGPGEAPTVDFHGPTDRAPLSTSRLTGDLGITPNVGMHAALADYLAWIDTGGTL